MTETKPQNLMQGLIAEKNRCTELLRQYEAIGPEGQLGAAFIRHGLQQADEAMGSGDVIAMLRSYQELQGFE